MNPFKNELLTLQNSLYRLERGRKKPFIDIFQNATKIHYIILMRQLIWEDYDNDDKADNDIDDDRRWR